MSASIVMLCDCPEAEGEGSKSRELSSKKTKRERGGERERSSVEHGERHLTFQVSYFLKNFFSPEKPLDVHLLSARLIPSSNANGGSGMGYVLNFSSWACFKEAWMCCAGVDFDLCSAF